MKTLDQLWKEQQQYNKKIRERENPDNYEYWMKQYILGAVSEVDEILQEINWKIHRRGHVVDKHNLARELADLTKYVWCMWEWSDFGPLDMLEFLETKNKELQEQYSQDFQFEIPEGVPVLISDIDGTLGDYRKAFFKWAWKFHPEGLLPEVDPSRHMAMEIDMGLPYAIYMQYKEEFEATGGYGFLETYPDTEDVLKELGGRGAVVLVYTARPAKRYSRIWSDTWTWLEKNNLHIPVSALRIGSEERIAQACELLDKGHQVLMLEDDPSLALRAANAGVTIALRSQPYNRGVQHNNIWRFVKYDPFTLKDFLGMEW